MFYESLYREKGAESEMAERWVVLNGVLDDAEADKVVKRWGKEGSTGGAMKRRVDSEAKDRREKKKQTQREQEEKEQVKDTEAGRKEGLVKKEKELLAEGSSKAAPPSTSIKVEAEAKSAAVKRERQAEGVGAGADGAEEDEQPLSKRLKKEEGGSAAVSAVKQETAVQMEQGSAEEDDDDDHRPLALRKG